ncbi:hypothetical protein BC629DRAFT_1535741 [Irpex lacteus]|nr:hypothetical protein BC629DRAFT_1547867 [Irpex lacteus]KAI0768950.1 hypothetical protein BC629DRAFT_1535741 [Irpex lacteus]
MCVHGPDLRHAIRLALVFHLAGAIRSFDAYIRLSCMCVYVLKHTAWMSFISASCSRSACGEPLAMTFYRHMPLHAPDYHPMSGYLFSTFYHYYLSLIFCALCDISSCVKLCKVLHCIKCSFLKGCCET